MFLGIIYTAPALFCPLDPQSTFGFSVWCSAEQAYRFQKVPLHSGGGQAIAHFVQFAS
jgi:hypothetical protein